MDKERKEEQLLMTPIEEDEVASVNPIIKIISSIIVLVVIISVFYVYGGIQQLLLFQPTSPDLEQSSIESTLSLDNIIVPVNVFAIMGDNGTQRTYSEIHNLLIQNQNIWSQADVKFSVENISFIEIDEQNPISIIQDPISFLDSIEGYRTDQINLFLTRRFSGLNGVAFPGLKVIFLADITTTRDFRVLAHEIGHILGLRHTDSMIDLMYQGAQGVRLSEQEILQARDVAAEMFP